MPFPNRPSCAEGHLGGALLRSPEPVWTVAGASDDANREAFTVRLELQLERSCRTSLLSLAAMSAKEPSVAWGQAERIGGTSPGGGLSGRGLSAGRLRISSCGAFFLNKISTARTCSLICASQRICDLLFDWIFFGIFGREGLHQCSPLRSHHS
jgi:hypothetical protein